ncbi:hypothetical protein H4P12_05380 [Paracoccus sp. 11-3]|uniref:Uncharacterized protein n=1 Tax=Paracoccus amoyensis TaxID=2760093 RepID=A0A926GF11_9RHOB|nr:hypothetical protein [Paracoccus amoyensis]MBC9246154.1 hypothetical protein [Paracoccus amoyensis]
MTRICIVRKGDGRIFEDVTINPDGSAIVNDNGAPVVIPHGDYEEIPCPAREPDNDTPGF